MIKLPVSIAIFMAVALLAAACGADSTPATSPTARPQSQPTPTATARISETQTRAPYARTEAEKPTADVEKGQKIAVMPTPDVSGGTKPEKVDLDIKGFTHGSITVPVGTTVVWTNRDPVGHTTTSGTPDDPTGPWDSPRIPQGNTFTFTFAVEGTYQYFCRVHPSSMQGVITVGPPGTPVSTDAEKET